MLAHESLIDDRELSTGVDFSFREAPSSQELRPQNRKIPFTAKLKKGIPVRLMNFSLNFDVRRKPSIGRERTHFSSIHNSRQGFEPRQQWPIKASQLVGSSIATLR